VIPPWDAGFLNLEHQLDQMFEELIYRRWAAAGRGAWRPWLDVRQTAEAYLVDVALPGVAPEEIQLLATPRDLTVAGERKAASPTGVLWEHCECPQGPFRRTVRFALPIDPEAAQAEYRHGVCRVRLPLAAGAQGLASAGAVGVHRSQWVLRVSAK
jgi:HSP20 family protein